MALMEGWNGFLLLCPTASRFEFRRFFLPSGQESGNAVYLLKLSSSVAFSWDGVPGLLIRPFSVGYVKGWRRSLAALIVIQGLIELEVDLEVLPKEVRVSWWLLRLQDLWVLHMHSLSHSYQTMKRCLMVVRLLLARSMQQLESFGT